MPEGLKTITRRGGIGTSLPVLGLRPMRWPREAARLLRPGGRVGLLHFQVPMFHRPLRLVGVFGITTGLGYNIRAFTLLEKGGFKQPTTMSRRRNEPHRRKKRAAISFGPRRIIAPPTSILR